MFKLICVDPSSKFNGVAIFTLSTATGKVEVEEIETVLLNTNEYGETSQHRLLKTIELFERMLERVNPLAFAYEEPFIHGMFKGAYPPLKAVTTGMYLSAHRFNPHMNIASYSPAQVKAAMGGKGGKGFTTKDGMRALAMSSKYLGQFVDISTVDEHSIDAIAVGLCWIKEANEAIELLIDHRINPQA